MTNREAKAVKKLLRSLRRNWIRVWLICAIGFLSIFAVYAAYTEVSSVKRVVSMQNTPELLFSSNCMGTTLQLRRLATDTYEITVCNYDQNKPDIFDEATITYTLNAYLQVLQNEERIDITDGSKYDIYNTALNGKLSKYTIKKVYDDADGNVDQSKEFDLGTVTFKGTENNGEYPGEQLAGGRSSTDRYQIKIDPADLTLDNAQVFIYVEAIQDSGSYQGETLKGRLYGQKSSLQAAKWSGAITDTDFKTRSDYDFYNYLISGSGAGTVDILWNPEMISINEYFLSIYGSDITTQTPVVIAANDAKYGSSQFNGKYVGWNMITLNVDSTALNRYELQLFKGQSFEAFPADYSDDNNDYIVCKFTGAVTGAGE